MHVKEIKAVVMPGLFEFRSICGMELSSYFTSFIDISVKMLFRVCAISLMLIVIRKIIIYFMRREYSSTVQSALHLVIMPFSTRTRTL